MIYEILVYCIKLGTLDNIEAADVEWVLRPYMNTTRKRQFLSTVQDDDDDVEPENNADPTAK